jgi:cation diffusion facilitator CzcD-associated flavoprotein CzcO
MVASRAVALDDDMPIAIVGAGFAGLCMGIELKRAGISSFIILERAADLGGTWRDNHYPGCACDVQAHLYSFSFEPNPGWSRLYAGQREIWQYLRGCADKHGLAPHIRFGAEVVKTEWSEEQGLWHLHTASGAVHRARVLVSAMGALSNPAYPAIDGLDRFQGARFHSATWDHGFDLDGKRVAVIGTGASAIQFVPQIAPRVAQLDVYQRTPPWIIPRLDRPVSAFERFLFRRLPFTQRLRRSAIYWKLESRVLAFAVNPRLMKIAERTARRHMRRQVTDGELRRKLTPDYTIGCKRILISDDYYPAFSRPSVALVTDPVREVRARSVVTADGRERETEAIIFGTGFTVQEPVRPGAVVGRGGVDLTAAWKGGMEAYKGTAVSGFPNLFFILGPNTGLGHSSMIYMIESQVAYVVDAVRQMIANRWSAVDVSADAQAAYNRALEARQRGAVWQTGCKSWYLDRNGRNTALWPGFTFRFRRQTRRFDAAAYHVRT